MKFKSWWNNTCKIIQKINKSDINLYLLLEYPLYCNALCKKTLLQVISKFQIHLERPSILASERTVGMER